jgi:hypothetical protein
MAFDEGSAYDQANAWKVKYTTLKDNTDRMREDARAILDMFGARKKENGAFSIDFEKVANNLGIEQCLELRRVIDEVHSISGEPGQKPRVRMKANAAVAPEA